MVRGGQNMRELSDYCKLTQIFVGREMFKYYVSFVY